MDNYLLLPRALESAVYYGCFATVVGALLAWPRLDTGDSAEALRRTAIVCAALLVLLLPAQLWLMTATMLSTVSENTVRSMLVEVLTDTHAGRLLIPEMLVGSLLLAVTALRRAMRRRGGVYVALSLAVLLAAMRAANGHASSDGDFTLREFVQFLHLFSIAVWAGSILIAGWLVLPDLGRGGSPTAIGEFGRTLSATATVAVALVALSGIYNGWQGLGGTEAHWNELVGSQWGWLLTAKTILVAVALTLGAANRWLLRGTAPLSTENVPRFLFCMRCEAAVMVAILGVTGFLANSPPAVGQ